MWLNRLLNTVRQGDFYLITEDFDSCECPSVPYNPVLTVLVDIQAQAMVDAAYQDRIGWIKKSISTSAKVSTCALRTVITAEIDFFIIADG